MSYISVRGVQKPKRLRWCDGCGSAMLGAHLVFFGDFSESGEPHEVRTCLRCADENCRDEQVEALIVKLAGQCSHVPSSDGVSPEQVRERMAKANELLTVIAGCGRKFFDHKGEVSRFELNERGLVVFWDSYTKKLCPAYAERYDWPHFTNGGTLRSLVVVLARYIWDGTPRKAMGSEHWGYDEHMQVVRDAAARLGIVESRELASNI